MQATKKIKKYFKIVNKNNKSNDFYKNYSLFFIYNINYFIL